MNQNRNYCLSIAGFDPSSGAGLSADLKTFEMHKVYGFSVCSAITVQNEIEFQSCDWISKEKIISQLEILLKRFPISVIKIGIVESWEILLEIIDFIESKIEEPKIILDPVLRSSSNFVFHSNEKNSDFEKVLQKCYLLTPNYQEIQQIFPDKNVEETIFYLNQFTNIFLKGGHKKSALGEDALYLKNGEEFIFKPKESQVFEKHGSGCVLASAIAANLANNLPIGTACQKAKEYTFQFLNSTENLLGYHNL
ncbi:hydroxymethylpyrimidine/phosphomethylpyrimidine kinase [Aureivirga marina]|uniref:hydroxymethylpyrimidine/phosphomethylpyrimidine kinase n=1 Tax=Aureivirga marina TaxID=1182451 RepID=UPI0018CA905F|nr:hydroxymethylpyrimidine/phosphomethylpyrimidine kinase [Aureivirga marina]